MPDVSDITIVSAGANYGARQIMERRIQDNVARAILRDLWTSGLMVVRCEDWERASRLVQAVRDATAVEQDDGR